MISNSREKGATVDKEKGNKYCNKNEQIKDPYSTWPGLKNPRIVRVSRAFGGKDRHSKVTTVRGLRDRRIRLSAQTAIELYDLQEKLGFNQPSKVVDWLINAAQHEIDKLPPLQMPSGSNCFPFPQFINPLMNGFDNNRVQAQNGMTMKDSLAENSLYWIRSEEAMKKRENDNQASSSRANVGDQCVMMPNNPTSHVPYSLQDSMNAYTYYSGNHWSQPEVFNPIPPLGRNFDWKNYSNFHSLSLMSSSQGNQAFKNQRTRNDEHDN